MATELHCSACDALIPAGTQKCPGCGLQLTAIAQPAVYAYVPRYSWTLVILVGFAAAWVLGTIINSHDEAAAADAKTAFLTDLQAGKLNTVEAFEARCGEPRWTKQTTKGEELHYRFGAIDYYVTLKADGPELQQEHMDIENGKPDVWRAPLAAESIYQRLGCK